MIDLTKIVVGHPYRNSYIDGDEQVFTADKEIVFAKKRSDRHLQNIFTGEIYHVYDERDTKLPYINPAFCMAASSFFNQSLMSAEILLHNLQRANSKVHQNARFTEPEIKDFWNATEYGTGAKVKSASDEKTPASLADEPKSTSKHTRIDLRNIHKIKEEVLGQDEAIARLEACIVTKGVGFRQNHLPIGSFYFGGPTGVGKTQTAKEMAKALYGNKEKLYREDMSTFFDKHSLSRFIGAEPGYEGFNIPTGIINFMKKHGEGVIVFDEVDKCHPKVLDVLMGILQEGEMTTATGERISFAKCFIVCTSNITEYPYTKEGDKIEGFEKLNIRQRLSAHGVRDELIGRFDEVISFKRLSAEIINKISKNLINKQLEHFNTNSDLKIEIACADSYIQLMSDLADTDTYGARELNRIIREKLTGRLSYFYVQNQDFIKRQGKFNALIKSDGSVYWPTTDLMNQLHGAYSLFDGQRILSKMYGIEGVKKED